MSDEHLATRLSGAVWGHLVADAVGVPYEFKDASRIGTVVFGASGTHSQPPGTWSDDGALMLAMLDSLLEVGFDPEDQGRRAVDWYRNGTYTPDGTVFDIGNTTSEALRALEGGAEAINAGPTHEHASGNGSLMRILGLALVDRDISDRKLVERAFLASRVTHGTANAQVACAVYSLIVRRLLAGAGGWTAALTSAFLGVREAIPRPSDDHAASAELLAALDHLEGYKGRGGRGVVWDSFWSAWDAFAGADSYQATIERAVAYGDDTDTTAAIAGGLAGIRWGIDAIPAKWLGEMRGWRVAGPIVDRLLATDGWKTSSANPIRVDWADLTKVPALDNATGRLGMTFLPGKQRKGYGGPNWRDLEADVARLRTEYATDDFLLLVEDFELEMSRVGRIADVMSAAGINLIRFPIVDVDIPKDPAALRPVLDDIEQRLRDGRNVVVACRGGLGRTGTIVGCILRDGGLDGAAAIRLTRASRRGTIETGDQEQFVRDWPLES